MKAIEAVVAWTEADEPDDSPFAATRGQVRVGPMAEQGDWSSAYMNTTGGAHREAVRGSSRNQGFEMFMMMVDFREVVMAGFDPKAVDEAFCAIDEWREHFHHERIRYPGQDEEADELARACANEE